MDAFAIQLANVFQSTSRASSLSDSFSNQSLEFQTLCTRRYKSTLYCGSGIRRCIGHTINRQRDHQSVTGTHAAEEGALAETSPQIKNTGI